MVHRPERKNHNFLTSPAILKLVEYGYSQTRSRVKERGIHTSSDSTSEKEDVKKLQPTMLMTSQRSNNAPPHTQPPSIIERCRRATKEGAKPFKTCSATKIQIPDNLGRRNERNRVKIQVISNKKLRVTADGVHGAKQGPRSEAAKPSKTFISEEINTTADSHTRLGAQEESKRRRHAERSAYALSTQGSRVKQGFPRSKRRRIAGRETRLAGGGGEE
ncbi:unnamed protein product [Caenorhabditis nigoni]